MNEIFELLSALDDGEIQYVSWKNNHELEMALSGGSDIDLYVDILNRAEFCRLANGLCWVEFRNPIADYYGVSHFYKSDGCGIYHCHVYFRVTTGESWLKEFELPIGSFLLENRLRHQKYGVWVLDRRAQAYLHIVRLFLKNGSVLSRLLYAREIDGYIDEWNSCDTSIQELYGLGPIKLDLFLEKCQSYPRSLPTLYDCHHFRNELKKFRRFGNLPFRRFSALSQRFLNKYVIRRKKLFVGAGVLVAITGVDGSGKSTMVGEISEHFSRFISVRLFTLGKPQGVIIESLRKRLSGLAPRDSTNKYRNVKKVQVSIFVAMKQLYLAKLRRDTAVRARNLSRKGYLVISDRWPTGAVGVMDGPKIIVSNGDSAILRFLANLEKSIYRDIPPVDYCYHLSVPLGSAIDRNKLRIKPDKESDSEISVRYRDIETYRPFAIRTTKFDNDGPLLGKKEDLARLIWNDICASRV